MSEVEAVTTAKPQSEHRLTRLQSVVQQATDLQTAVDMYQDEWRQAPGEIIRTAIRAQAKKEIYQILDGPFFEAVIASKAGQPDGFDVDTTAESKKPHNIKVAVATALLNGLRLDGKEFGVIAGGFYMERAGADRLLREWPGVTEVDYHLGLPDVTTRRGEAIVECKLTFRLHGEPKSIEHLKTGEIDQRLAVRVNAGQMTDAIHGKARRKLAVRALQLLSGIPDIGGVDEDNPATPEDVDAIEADFAVHTAPEPEAAQDGGAPSAEALGPEDQPEAEENSRAVNIDAEKIDEVAQDRVATRDKFLARLEDVNLDSENAKAQIQEIVDQAQAHAETGELSPSGYEAVRERAKRQYKATTN